jgi:hypothetical protein
LAATKSSVGYPRQSTHETRRAIHSRWFFSYLLGVIGKGS